MVAGVDDVGVVGGVPDKDRRLGVFVFLAADVDMKVLKVFIATSSKMFGMQSGSSQMNLPVLEV